MEKVIELIQSAGDGAFAIDRLQRVVFWNDACQSILGYAPADVLGQPCYEVIGGTAEDGCLVCRRDCAPLESRADRSAVPTRHLHVNHKDGSQRWITVSTLLVPSAWRDLSVLVHLICDVTAHKNTEILVRQLADEVSAATDIGASDPYKRPAVGITEREHEILRAMATGRTSPEIADELNISKATVRNHTHSIFSKLGVRNRLEAIVVSLRRDML